MGVTHAGRFSSYASRCGILLAVPAPGLRRERTAGLQISLQSTHWTEARRIGAELTAMSEVVFDEMRRGRLNQDEARAILVAVARRHAAKLELIATVDRALDAPGPMSRERADRINGAVYRLLAERGRAAEAPVDAGWLRSCGLDPNEADQVKTILEFYRRQGLVPRSRGGCRA